MELTNVHLKLSPDDINRALHRWLPENSFITHLQAVPMKGYIHISGQTRIPLPLVTPKTSPVEIDVAFTASGNQILADFTNLKLKQKTVPFEKQIISRLLQKLPVTAGIKTDENQMIFDANILAGNWVQAAKLQVHRIYVTSKMVGIKLTGKITA